MNRCIAPLIFRQTIPYDLHSYNNLRPIMNMRNAQILQHRTHSFRFSQTCLEQMGFRGGQAYNHHKPRRNSLLKQWIDHSGHLGFRSVQNPQGKVWFHSSTLQSPCLHIRTYSIPAHCHSFPRTSPGYVTGCVECMQKVFTDGAISEANTSASLIVAQALGHKTLHGVPSKTVVNDAAWKQMVSMAKERMHRVPVQYVLGEWDFLDLTLTMRPPVFIPRPETEELVQHVLAENEERENIQFLEIGSGSGAISVYLLSANQTWTAVAVEQGDHAFALTSHNAQQLGTSHRLQALHLEFNRDIDINVLLTDGPFDLIVSNPPYMALADMADLQSESAKFEDPRAFKGGEDGLDVIRDILELAPVLLKPGGSLWLEVDSSHPPAIESILKDTSLTFVKALKDLNYLPRFVHIRKEPEDNTS